MVAGISNMGESMIVSGRLALETMTAESSGLPFESVR